MIVSIVGAILSFLLLVNGFAALRRPLDELVKYDPLGRRLLERRGEKFTLRMYRLFGLAMVALGLVAGYASIYRLIGN
ncbi:MAG: hypothetical protein KatS3mg052_2122 [Candidatus Roseilinea sp.]|nr:MAG: hypothetical protein KatS3mg052_2122 [Candidatus Roseilinea sp.]